MIDPKTQETLEKSRESLHEALKRRDALVKSFLAGYQVLLLADKENYPLLEKAKEKLEEEDITGCYILEDIGTPHTTDSAKMANAVRLCQEGTIVMIHGKGAGTVTEVTDLTKNLILRLRTILFFSGEDYPDIAFSHTEYPAYFPRKYYYRDEEKFLHLLVRMIKQDAYVEANEQADKILNGGCK